MRISDWSSDVCSSDLGVKYKITNNGSTIMVPKDDVHATRISLSGKGLPASSDKGGYELLDDQSFTTGEFKEQTDFKRAMEGELSNTIEAMDGVNKIGRASCRERVCKYV